MQIIDLTLPLYDGMPVYPGDHEVSIKRIQTFAKDGWNMQRLKINSHDGTHVNVPIHGTKAGRNLDSYEISNFFGKATIFKAEKIVRENPKFIGLSNNFEFNIEVEKYLSANNIVSYENLVNCEKLPSKFTFYGVPLKIKEGDGSPLRAFALY